MSTNRIHTITTDDGTRIDITVDGRNFRIDGSAPTSYETRPVERWELQHELASVKLLIIGFGMVTALFSAFAFFSLR